MTGAAGFIGSHLCEALVAGGDQVVGIDSFTPYYERARKEENLTRLGRSAGFRLITADLSEADLIGLVDKAEVVYHLAGQPGVRSSFSEGFRDYAENNIVATQRLLEAAVAVGTPRLVFASSSSVYGDAERFPTAEDSACVPLNPYGVTKLAAEHLCGMYARASGLSVAILRYFSVYGPRQRPDMAFCRIIDAALGNAPVPIYGDGTQMRDFTHVSDVVSATMAAGASTADGDVFNVASGTPVALSEVLDLVSELAGRPVLVTRFPRQRGDVERTGGDITRARERLGWSPVVDIRVGLASQVTAALKRAEPASQAAP